MQRNISYDLIRATAIFFVVCIHSMGLVNEALSLESSIEWAHITNALMGIIYSGVPLFVMLSGALLLGKEESLKVFFQRRMQRVLIPFLVWSVVVYAILFWQDGGRALTSFVCTYTVKSLTEGVYGIYWYVYMLIGLYAITPPIRVILHYGGDAIFTYLLVLILVVAIIGEAIPEISVVKRLYFESSICLFYFLVGYFMSLKRESIVRNKLSIRILFIILLIIKGVLCLFELSFELLNVTLYITLFMFLLSLSVYSASVTGVIRLISRYSYGIYLSHFMLISAFLKLNVFQHIPMLIEPVCMATAVLLADIVILYVLNKMKLGKFVM